DHMPDPGLDRVAQQRLGLVVPVQVDAGRVEAGAKRGAELAAGGDVDREPLLAGDPAGGDERGRLARVEDLESVGVALEGHEARAGASPDVVLGVQIGGAPAL